MNPLGKELARETRRPVEDSTADPHENEPADGSLLAGRCSRVRAAPAGQSTYRPPSMSRILLNEWS